MSVIVVLLLIASVVFLFVPLRSGETLSFETTADPHRAIAALVGLLAARRRWQTVSQSEHGAHFVYIASTRRRESLVVSVGSAGAETFVRVASNGRRGKAVGRALRRHVGFAAALGTCVNAVSRGTPFGLTPAPRSASSPALAAIISGLEIPVSQIGDDGAIPAQMWSALDDRLLAAEKLHS